MEKNEINVVLSNSEALVLFEFLSRFDEKDGLSIQHDSEKRVLNNILVLLEKDLTEPFDQNYQVLLKDAQQKILRLEKKE